MSEYLDLYHRTTAEAARAIIDTGRFRTRENTAEAYVSTQVDGQGTGYGEAVVQVRVDAARPVRSWRMSSPTGSSISVSPWAAPRSSRRSPWPRTGRACL